MSRNPATRVVVAHAVRVTVATSAVFYLCLYGFEAEQMAVFASFGVVGVGVLSDVAGAPRQRLLMYLIAFAAGVPLVIVGSLAARSTALAATGMLVVGLMIGMAATCGGRVFGLANGLQLFYILPSFPPFAPGQIPARIGGLALGIAALIIADVLVRPSPGQTGYPTRLADGADLLAGYLRRITAGVRAGASSAGDESTERERADLAARLIRPESLPVSLRPTGPSPHDQALRTARISLQLVWGRLRRIDHVQRTRPAGPDPGCAELLDTVAAQLQACGSALARADGVRAPARAAVDASPATGPLASALERFERVRLSAIEDCLGERARELIHLRMHAVAGELARATEVLVQATLAVCRRGPADPSARDSAGTLSDQAMFAAQQRRSVSQLASNLRQHLRYRSVILQNAVRLAIGLALARVVAGSLDLSHGFWVLLATLTVMRTTTSATRGALWTALAGSCLGAAVAGALLATEGAHVTFFAVLMPTALLVAQCGFQLGLPILGQACFTLVVAALFTQIVPATWHLAEARIADVSIGALIGLATGLFVWPRGGASSLRVVLADHLRHACELAGAALEELLGTGRAPGAELVRATGDAEVLASTAFAQFRSESQPDSPELAELARVLSLSRRLSTGAARLRSDRLHAAGPEQTSAAARLLEPMAQVRWSACTRLASVLTTEGVPSFGELDECDPQAAAWLERFAGAPTPALALDVIDGWSWLVGVGHDLEELATASASARSPSAGAARPAESQPDASPSRPFSDAIRLPGSSAPSSPRGHPTVG